MAVQERSTAARVGGCRPYPVRCRSPSRSVDLEDRRGVARPCRWATSDPWLLDRQLEPCADLAGDRRPSGESPLGSPVHRATRMSFSRQPSPPRYHRPGVPRFTVSRLLSNFRCLVPVQMVTIRANANTSQSQDIDLAPDAAGYEPSVPQSQPKLQGSLRTQLRPSSCQLGIRRSACRLFIVGSGESKRMLIVLRSPAWSSAFTSSS